jgi:predicted  nucleic acid-binding Zn-ribbon protein
VSALSPLLDVQALDLERDALAERRRTLPEREALRRAHARAGELDADHAALLERRDALTRSEHTLATEVAEVARHAKESEDTLYSGSVRVAKELASLQEEVRLIRAKQSGLEEQEMTLLEEIDGLESAMRANREEREALDVETARLEAALRAAESEIDAQVAGLVEKRAGQLGGIPAPVLAEYERLRGKERLHGRAAAPLAGGNCGGCRVQLPVLEYNKMKAQPEDALLVCPHCARILVR